MNAKETLISILRGPDEECLNGMAAPLIAESLREVYGAQEASKILRYAQAAIAHDSL